MKNFLFSKKIIISIVVVMILSGVFFVGLFFYRQSPVKSLGKIVYGYQAWPGVLPYLVAYDEGFFKKRGLEVEMVKEESYVSEMDGLVSGRLDFVGDIALIDVVEKVSLGNDLRVVLATDYSAGADGIVAKKNIKTVVDLKGKKVAVEQGTLGEYLLYDALRKDDLGLGDVFEVNLSAQDSAQAFIRGEVDAAVTYEPDFSQAVDRGKGWRLYTSADSPGLIIDVLAFNADFLTKNETKVSAVVSAYLEAIDFIKTNPDKAYAIGAKYFKITPVEFKEQLSGIKLLNKEDNLTALSYKTSIDSLHGAIIQANNFLIEKGTLKNRVDSLKIIDARFIRGLKD